MLTARDAVGDRVRGLDAGAHDYLVKPMRYYLPLGSGLAVDLVLDLGLGDRLVAIDGPSVRGQD